MSDSIGPVGVANFTASLIGLRLEWNCSVACFLFISVMRIGMHQAVSRGLQGGDVCT